MKSFFGISLFLFLFQFLYSDKNLQKKSNFHFTLVSILVGGVGAFVNNGSSKYDFKELGSNPSHSLSGYSEFDDNQNSNASFIFQVGIDLRI